MASVKAWKHQTEDLEASWQLPAAAIHWEPRLGKSWLTLKTSSRLVEANKIRGAVVIAPNGVHLGWTRDQIPKHWDVENTRIVEWSSNRANTKGFQKELGDALAFDGFVFFSVNVESIRRGTKNKKPSASYDFIEKLAKNRDCIMVVDESHYIKNPKAERTKAIMKLSKLFPYRRNLTGTPSPQGPFDLWSQFNVLNPKILGRAFYPFKTRYGIFKKSYGQGRIFDELVEYRDLDDLARKIAPITFERFKDDCLDLPERIFSKQYFEMPPEHAKQYKSMRNNLVAQLDSGETITARMAMVQLLRLQQISRGHITDEFGERRYIASKSGYPAIDLAVRLIKENLPRKSIVWCQFVPDVLMLQRALELDGLGSICCHGETPPDDRPGMIKTFNEVDDGKPWIGTLATGGIGVDLGNASLMIFYSHGFNLAQRLQGLERNYGDSQKADKVGVVDIVAPDTADDRALGALERKIDLSRQLTAKSLRELIT